MAKNVEACEGGTIQKQYLMQREEEQTFLLGKQAPFFHLEFLAPLSEKCGYHPSYANSVDTSQVWWMFFL
jgi:uracil-DNA glycosylase